MIFVTAVMALAVSSRVSADETCVLVAGQGFEVALPGTGSHFTPAPQGTFLAEGSAVRTGKNGWAILRLGSDTQVELRADGEVAFSSVFRSGAPQKTGAENDRSNRLVSGSTSSAFTDTSPGTSTLAMEVKLRHGALAALADGATELRVSFANSVTTATHARFTVKTGGDDHARVIVERGTTHIFVSGDKKEISPMAGQFVDVNKLVTGHVVAAVQPIRSNDTDAVAEMAALRFVPALVEPAVKSLPTVTDNSTAIQPTATTSTTSSVTAATTATSTSTAPVVSSANQFASTAAATSLPSTSVVQSGAVATASYSVAPPGTSVSVDPLQAPANGANIKGPVTSPEHP